MLCTQFIRRAAPSPLSAPMVPLRSIITVAGHMPRRRPHNVKKYRSDPFLEDRLEASVVKEVERMQQKNPESFGENNQMSAYFKSQLAPSALLKSPLNPQFQAVARAAQLTATEPRSKVGAERAVNAFWTEVLYYSPKKLRLLTTLISDLPVKKAVEQLDFSKSKVAAALAAHLYNAAATMAQERGIPMSHLVVRRAVTTRAPGVARKSPRLHARGRFGIMTEKKCFAFYHLEEQFGDEPWHIKAAARFGEYRWAESDIVLDKLSHSLRKQYRREWGEIGGVLPPWKNVMVRRSMSV